MPGVRIDAAIVPYKDGYVLAGRNMREMESHIEHLGGLMVAGWLATLALTLVMCAGAWLLLRRKT